MKIDPTIRSPIEEIDMKAIVRKRFGGPEVLEVIEAPEPAVRPGCILIRVRAFGLNRAELYMRRGLWGDVAEISGIECVGAVVVDATGVLREGQTVTALMGGMGRTINGSDAEYVAVPASNVVAVETTLDIGCQLGADVIATTRRSSSEALLRSLGAAHVVTTAEDLLAAPGWPGGKADAVLDLIGNSTVLDSLRATRRGGHVCLAGFLGGLAPPRRVQSARPDGKRRSDEFFWQLYLRNPGIPAVGRAHAADRGLRGGRSVSRSPNACIRPDRRAQGSRIDGAQ